MLSSLSSATQTNNVIFRADRNKSCSNTMKILAVFIMAILSLGSSSKVNTSGNNSTPGSSTSKDDGTKCICNCHESGSKQEISELVKTMAKMEDNMKKMAQNITNMLHTKIDDLQPANAVGKGK